MPVSRREFFEGLNLADEKVRKAIRRAVNTFAEHVIGDAQQLTPVKTGFLQASGTTKPAAFSGDELTKEIGFNAEYAAAVHERLQNKHEVGQAKFLSTAMQKNASKFWPYVASEVRQELDSGGD